MKEELKAGVGLSRKWDAREAGREVAETALEKLDGEKPKFFLLFSTIHYEKYGGFQELLNGVWEVLPEGTPLIGGTVAGFMNNYGCYTRGATALTVAYPNMDVAVGVGKNTKRDPRGATKSAYDKLISTPTSYPNNFIIELVATAVIPKLPSVGQKNVILSKKIGDTFVKLLPTLEKIGYGFDRADEIIELLAGYFPDRVIVGGCTMDDNKFLRNYQFVDKDVTENSLALLHVSSDLRKTVHTITSYTLRGERFKITRISRDRHVVKEFNGEGARTALLRRLNLHIEEKEAVYSLYKNIYYYPLAYYKNNTLRPCMIGLIYGENLIFGNRIESNELDLLAVSVDKAIQQIERAVQNLENKNTCFIYGVACETYVETLGSNIYRVHRLLEETNAAFVLPFVAGESIYIPEKGAHHLYESIHLLGLNI
ncbi:MAG TPA: hypothetical protein ENG74_01945 [Thermoplasmatales archaeon]|nr:MAG: hypothetical protein DRN03_00960 [Thermoplasmata archaeon]HDO19468.1 hypothetical protein [Thermoplasmatales archaeon]